MRGDAVADVVIQALAHRYGGAGGLSRVAVLATVDDLALAAALDGSAQAVIQAAPCDDVPCDLFARTLAADGLFVSLTTVVTFGLPAAALFCDALERRGALSAALRPHVELALHEAVANAVVHGNLSLSSRLRGSLQNYNLYCQSLDELLKDPVLSQRRVDIAATWDAGALTLTVADEGAGYVPADVPAAHSSARVPTFGRGLALMRGSAAHITLTHGGRRVTMEFTA